MKVLIAEDDPVLALGLTERVRLLGHDPIAPVGDGEQAVAEAKASLPDLYLFDIEMPTLDGLAAAVQLAGEGLRQRSDELVKTLEGRGEVHTYPDGIGVHWYVRVKDSGMTPMRDERRSELARLVERFGPQKAHRRIRPTPQRR
jgi:hypothetical protein